jgi:hypothetical protein
VLVFPRLALRAWLTTSFMLCLLAPHASALTIYYDGFDRSSGPLDGTSPETRPGNETWMSPGTNWEGDGSIDASSSFESAWVPFIPLPNRLYRLSLSVNPEASDRSDWFALGYGSSSSQGAFYDSAGGPWMLNRSDDASSDVVQTFTGWSENPFGHDLVPNRIGFVDLAIELDTRSPAWAFEFFADGDSIRSGVFQNSNPDIRFVGFGNHQGLLGAVDDFSLVATVPEPNTALLMAIGLVVLVAPRAGVRAPRC